MKTLRLVLPGTGLCALLLVLVGCTSSGTMAAGSFLSHEDTSTATSDGFPAPSREMVWQAAMGVVRDAGYVPDPNLSREDLGHVESRWRMALQPFAGRGYRERVTLQVVKVPKRHGYYQVQTNVMRQLNDNMSEPGNPMAVEWATGKRDEDMEHMINQRVELTFLRGDVSNTYRLRHGMPRKQPQRISQPEPKPKEEGPIPGLPPLPVPFH
jgi:hypothetical protein